LDLSPSGRQSKGKVRYIIKPWPKMRHLKAYESYTEDDLQGLLGDLESIGQVKKTRFELSIEFPLATDASHPSWWRKTSFIFAATEVVDSGNLQKMASSAFKKIKAGEFIQRDSESTRSRLTDLQEIENKKIQDILSPDSIIKIANSSKFKSTDESSNLIGLVGHIKTLVLDEIVSWWEEIHEPMISKMSPNELSSFSSTPFRSSPNFLRSEIFRYIFTDIKNKPIS
jgi:hypothetical protein